MPLSRSEVLDGALRLLDEVGLDALTMRRLADSLGVQAGAIYWHFANKQELQDAMVDASMSGLLEPRLEGAWDKQLAEISRRIVAALSRYRDGARLATTAIRPGPHGLAASEAMLQIVRDAGFDKELTMWATSVLGYFLLGYVTDVQALESARRRGLEESLRSVEAVIAPDKYPQLFEVSRGGLEQMMSPREFTARFEFGLAVILTGLKAAKRRPKKRKPARRASKR